MYIDVTRLVGRLLKRRLPTGVDRVGIEYIKHYGARSGAVIRLGRRHIILGRQDAQTLFTAIVGDPDSFSLSHCLSAWKGLSSMIRKIDLNGAILLNTGHTGLERRDYARTLVEMNVKPVFMIHDLIPITHPEYCRDGERARHIARMETATKAASGLIFNSDDTRQEFVKFANDRNAITPQAAVAHLAGAPLPVPAEHRPLEKPYFVMISTIEGRKNHVMMLNIWKKMVFQMGSSAPMLVIIGQRGWEAQSAFSILDRCDSIKGVVLELGHCSDSELSTWLKHAQALLFPSFAEGYGMPLAEALTHGTPVIASDLRAFNEISNIPKYLNPLDAKGWEEAIVEYAAINSEAQIKASIWTKKFEATTWTEHFENVDRLIERIK